jgi:hypothetical protein
MANPWQQAFEEHRDNVDKSYLAEKYGQHQSDEKEETQALYDLRNKLKNMGKDAVMAYLKRSKMSPERKARLARELGVSIVGEEFATEGMAAQAIRLGLMAGTAAAGAKLVKSAKGINKELNAIQQKKIDAMKKYESEELEGEQIDEKITAKTDMGDAIRDFQGSKDPRLAGRTKEERRKAAIAAVLQARRKAEKRQNEEVELQEEAKILVRVTKEDGSIFQKKIPASALQDYRKRYKTVVVVGSSEGGGDKTGGQPNVNEEKEEVKRWWDDDGDGKGWEKGEVSGSFKKKKKTKKESYSNWKEENPELYEATKAQKSVEGKAHTSHDDGEEKKKRKKNADESECDCSHEVEESAKQLAAELGGELVSVRESVQVLSTGAKVVQHAPKALNAIMRFIRTIPKTKPPKPTIKPSTPAPIVPAKPATPPVPKPQPVKPTTTPQPGKPTKPAEPETQPKPEKAPDKSKPGTKTDTKVKTDNKTGAIVAPGSATTTDVDTSIKTLSAPANKNTPPTKPTKPGKPSGVKKGPGLRIPKIPMPKPGITDPTAPASTLKV